MLAACGGTGPTSMATTALPSDSAAVDAVVKDLQAKSARFAPVDIAADIRGLPPNERETLRLLIEASQVIDALYLRQVWAGNESLLLSLAGQARQGNAAAGARLDYFILNKGPWSRIDDNEPFVPGVPAKPPEANFYPAGATKEEVEAWVASLPDAERQRATGFFTAIRRSPSGALMAVPYNVEYQGEVTRIASLLRAAAAQTTQPTLEAFLEARATGFLTNDYYASDVVWMELDASIEPTIGPYEVYEDEWFNYKAAFESFITVRDDAETAKLTRFGAELQGIEDNLPIDPKFRNPKLASMSPIRVVNTVFSSGDANHGVQTAAFNLPNDERVIREKGAKRVMLKNNQDAKFRMVLTPISKVALAPADQGKVVFESFFTHILMHELMHGLGPHDIRAAGRNTTVRQELKDTYSAIEEAKADVSGLWALQHLVDRGKLDARFGDTMYTTFLASIFRSLRFGINEAHGRGVAIQLNYFLDHGGVSVAPDGTFAVNAARIRDNVRDLTRDIMTIQAMGDYAAARKMIDGLGVVRPPVKAVLDKLAGVPVDISPRFVTANELLGVQR
jgi:hypothetical protein